MISTSAIRFLIHFTICCSKPEQTIRLVARQHVLTNSIKETRKPAVLPSPSSRLSTPVLVPSSKHTIRYEEQLGQHVQRAQAGEVAVRPPRPYSRGRPHFAPPHPQSPNRHACFGQIMQRARNRPSTPQSPLTTCIQHATNHGVAAQVCFHVP